MARYLILEFDDNDDASVVVEYVKQFGTLGGLQAKCKVRGLYAKPTRFCECGKEKVLVKGALVGSSAPLVGSPTVLGSTLITFSSLRKLTASPSFASR